jgi:hypothetical protein
MKQPNKVLVINLNLSITDDTVIIKMIDMFNIEKVVAMGNKAEESLNKLGISCVKVRHPAQGGKSEFDEGIRKIKR